jgi:hypothetical protein
MDLQTRFKYSSFKEDTSVIPTTWYQIRLHLSTATWLTKCNFTCCSLTTQLLHIPIKLWLLMLRHHLDELVYGLNVIIHFRQTQRRMSTALLNNVVSSETAIFYYVCNVCPCVSLRVYEMNVFYYVFANTAIFVYFNTSLIWIVTSLLLQIIFPNATTCPYRLRDPTSWLWLKCNRLLSLGRPMGAVTLSR